jgi:hypothetical protein
VAPTVSAELACGRGTTVASCRDGGLAYPPPTPRQTPPTTLASFCQTNSYWDSTYGTTVCAGMDFNMGNDLGSRTYTGTTFSVALTSCQAFCFSMYSSAQGGFLVGSGSSTSHTCWCKGAVSGSFSQASCWLGAGFYKGERPVIPARASDSETC